MKQGWQKSSYCGNGACVEVSESQGQFLVRDGKDPNGPVLTFTVQEWDAFLAGASAGEFAPSAQQPSV